MAATRTPRKKSRQTNHSESALNGCMSSTGVADTKSSRARATRGRGEDASPMHETMENCELVPTGKVVYANGSIDFVLTAPASDPATEKALKFLRKAIHNRWELVDRHGREFRVTQQITQDILERVAQAASICTG